MSSPVPPGRKRHRLESEIHGDNLGANFRRRRRKHSGPLSARLLTAAVLTGVDVVGGPLVPGDKTSTRPPLRFSPADRAPSPVDVSSRTASRHFVHPCKAVSFDQTAFGPAENSTTSRVSGETGPIRTKKSRPITAWQPYLSPSLVGSTSRKSSQNPAVVKRGAMKPLKMDVVTHVGTHERLR